MVLAGAQDNIGQDKGAGMTEALFLEVYVYDDKGDGWRYATVAIDWVVYLIESDPDVAEAFARAVPEEFVDRCVEIMEER